jgi:hypothetical protein
MPIFYICAKIFDLHGFGLDKDFGMSLVDFGDYVALLKISVVSQRHFAAFFVIVAKSIVAFTQDFSS